LLAVQVMVTECGLSDSFWVWAFALRSFPQPAKSETKETNPKVAKLEEWLAKVKREEGRV